MPIYEYLCLACEERFDRLMPMSAGDPACPSCGDGRVRRQMSIIAGLTGSASLSSPSMAGSGCGCGGACACGR